MEAMFGLLMRLLIALGSPIICEAICINCGFCINADRSGIDPPEKLGLGLLRVGGDGALVVFVALGDGDVIRRRACSRLAV